MAPERKLYQDLKRNTPGILWNRVENLAGIGLPDCLGYNTSGHFFTVELKVTKSNSLRFSPHQIAFHKTHPHNTFILARTIGSRALKLVPGSMLDDLLRDGFACSSVACVSWPTVLERLLACWLLVACWSGEEAGVVPQVLIVDLLNVFCIRFLWHLYSNKLYSCRISSPVQGPGIRAHLFASQQPSTSESRPVPELYHSLHSII